jgi:tetratricopeptide (TPR) repeat protein
MDAGEYEEAAQKLEESAALCRALGDARGIADATWVLSLVHSWVGRVDGAEQLARECLGIARRLGDRMRVVGGLTALAYALRWAGKYAESELPAQERLAIYSDMGVRSGHGHVILGWSEIHQGQYEKGRAHLHTGLAIAREKGRGRRVVVMALVGLGLVAVCEGAHPEANRLLFESIGECRAGGLHGFLSEPRCALAYAARGLGDLEQARHQLVQALQWANQRRAFHVLIFALPAAALLLLDRGEKERAVEIYELARTLPAVANSRWFEDVAGRAIVEAAAALPPDVVAAARERGRARDLGATARELVADLEGTE